MSRKIPTLNMTRVLASLASLNPWPSPPTLSDAQASVTQREPVAHMATKKALQEPVAVVVTPAMLKGRMRLPSRVFTKGKRITIDGHTLTQQGEADQFRSTKFNPNIFGLDVAAGDTLVFEHEGGREWSVTLEQGRGKRPSKKAKAPAREVENNRYKKSAKPSKRASGWDEIDVDESEKPAKKAHKGNGKVSVDRGTKVNLGKEFDAFANIAIENANTKGFKQNEAIKSTNSTKGGPDARVYFTTLEHKRFRKMWKGAGLTFSKAIAELNKRVYDFD